MDSYKTNILHCLILSLVLLAGTILLFAYKNNPLWQFYIGIGLAVTYFIWGVVHHLLSGDLHRKHVIEYGLLALLGLVLLKIVLL